MKLSAIAALVLPASVAITTLGATPSLAGTPTWVTTEGITRNELNYTVSNTQSTDWVYATQAITAPFGTGITDNRRKTLSYATGAPQFAYDSSNNPYFLSLGVGGTAFFDFGTQFLPEITLWETTDGNKSRQSDYNEQVDVYVAVDQGSLSGNALTTRLEDNTIWTLLGDVKNITDGAYNNRYGATIKSKDSSIANSLYRYVKLVDKSQNTGGRDGFDVNAIAVKGVSQSVPEPASILGLLAFGAFGVSSTLKGKQQNAK
ncbi:MAG: PEP-CTERM sorting domain-containing protein [Nostocales cyanobacterium]|nr:MAG: PEP-CTERM sorting domain-containing protein [Nostocales cyanobacterium]